MAAGRLIHCIRIVALGNPICGPVVSMDATAIPPSKDVCSFATNRILVLAAYSSFAAFPMAPQFLLVRVIDADCETLPPAAVTVIE